MGSRAALPIVSSLSLPIYQLVFHIVLRLGYVASCFWSGFSYWQDCELKLITNFQPYHLTHHKSLGVDGLDVDVPTKFEALFLNSIAGKAFFCTFQIIFYAIRPMVVYSLPVSKIQLFNVAVQLAVDALFVWAAGSWNVLWYFIMSSFLAGSLHPCAGHFIAEHVGQDFFTMRLLPPPLSLSSSSSP